MIHTTFEEVFEQYTGVIYDTTKKERISPDQLKRMKEKMVAILKERGVRALERVGIVCQSSVLFILSFFSITEIGAVPIILNKKSTSEEIEQFDKRYGIHWLMNDLSIGEDYVCEFYTWHISHYNESAVISKDIDNCVLQPTSGTTGLFNLCVRDEYACLAEPQNHIETTSFAKHSKILCPLSLAHAYGFGTAFLTAFLSSSDLIVMDEMNVRTVTKIFREFKVDMMTGVPALYDLLCKMRLPDTMHLPEQLLSAGAPLSQELRQKFYQRFNRYILSSYGSTETGEMCIEHQGSISEAGCVGKALKYTKLKLVDMQEGYQVVHCLNPSRMKGYLLENGRIDSSSLLEEGYISTGDIASTDSLGNIILQGRCKNLINVFGVKVNPFEIEQQMREFSFIEDVHVYAGRHRNGSEIINAIVVLKEEVLEKDIINKCREVMLSQKVPSKICIVEEIPRNSANKIDRTRLLECI